MEKNFPWHHHLTLLLTSSKPSQEAETWQNKLHLYPSICLTKKTEFNFCIRWGWRFAFVRWSVAFRISCTSFVWCLFNSDKHVSLPVRQEEAVHTNKSCHWVFAERHLAVTSDDRTRLRIYALGYSPWARIQRETCWLYKRWAGRFSPLHRLPPPHTLWSASGEGKAGN